MTGKTERAGLLAGAVVALSVVTSCSSKPLFPADGGVVQSGAGGWGGTAGGGGNPPGGSSGMGGAAGMAGCYVGREFEGDITVVACSNGPGRIVAAASDLFWLSWGVDGDTSRGTLLAMPKSGGMIRPVAEVEDSLPSLRANGSRLFWTDRRSGDDGGVVQVAASGGVGLATLAEGLRRPGSLALDDSHAYFGTVDGNFRVPQSGGDVELVADGLPVDMQVADGMLYWLDQRSVPSELGPRESMAIFRVSVEGGMEPELLLRTFDDPGFMLIVGDRIFWTTNAQGEVWSMDVGGGTPALVLQNPFDEWNLCCSLTSDGESLFLGREGWPDGHPEMDGILRVSLDGTEVEDVVLQRLVDDIAVDAGFVYFSGRMETPEGLISGVFRVPR